MSCPEVTDLVHAVRQSKAHRFNDYIYKLQSRYGDPRQYAAEAEAMRREEAAILYDRTEANREQLRDAYARQAVKHRLEHDARMAKRSSRTKHPQSTAEPAPHTAAPPAAAPSGQQ